MTKLEVLQLVKLVVSISSKHDATGKRVLDYDEFMFNLSKLILDEATRTGVAV